MRAHPFSPFLRSAFSLVTTALAAALFTSPAYAAQNPASPQSASISSQWIQPHAPGDPLIWGRKDGILFGLPSPGGLRGPRGLIRVGLLSPTTGQPELINFIAVEPVILGPGSRQSRMAFSELEPSRLDPGQHGKRLWPDLSSYGQSAIPAGNIEQFPNQKGAIERLSVQIDVERFSANNAHVHLVASIDSDHPDELRLSVFADNDSPPIEELALTATMGNFERLRRLWLHRCVVDSRELMGSYTGDAFDDPPNYPLRDMLRTADGDGIVFATTNENNPSSTPAPGHWHYPLPRLTQYWRIAAHDIEPDLRVRVNGRRVYWASHDPVPGGIAYENFDVRQRYIPGQTFIFGITPKTPSEFTPTVPGIEPLPAGSGEAIQTSKGCAL
ncbi:MAG TPA: hypothetical protein VGM02_03000 [Acidobacteriaceae bacterium]|jgi:hypothetical protein